MDPPEVFYASAGCGNRPPPRKELQGPRPAVLKVNKDSHKIRKPPVPPPAHSQAPQGPSLPEDRQPVIIYAVSPKVIHTTVTDFMKLVQRLTGNAYSASNSGGAHGDLSPAARIASIEQTSASPKDREIITANSCNPTGVDDIMCHILESADVEVGPVPGIISPAPEALQPILPGFFSPAADPFSMMGYNNMFVPSPSTLFSAPMVSPSALFSAPMVSPSPSSCDLFNPFFDF
ncbi:protein MKS1-like [Primulina huaijiensis]|uniref:protein MKS1-like n=1 Tax=Primulina huaijiensis TaxID=1492673 RepID=UPI003CC780BD